VDNIIEHKKDVNVVLIYPAGFKDIKESPPTSLLSVAGIIKDICKVKIIDLDFEELDYLESNKVDIIGIQLYDPATYSQDQLSYLTNLLDKLRKFNALIVVGGWGGKSTVYLESGFVDILLCGLPGTLEQPLSFREIINAIAIKEKKIDTTILRKINGIMFYDNNKIIKTGSFIQDEKQKIEDFLTLPPEDENFEKYGLKPENYIVIENGKKISTFYVFFNTFSCSYYKCCFCSQAEEFENFIVFNKQCKRKINLSELMKLNVENACKKIENYMKALNADYFRVAVSDDIFDIEKLVLLINQIKSKGFFSRIKEIIFQTRADYITEESIDLLMPFRDILRINLGLESFNNPELIKMKKFPSGVNGLNKNINAINLLEKNKFKWNGTIIFTHWSTLETVKENFFQYFNLCSQGYNMSAVNSFYGLYIVGKLRSDTGPKEYIYLGKYIKKIDDLAAPFIMIPSIYRLTAQTDELIKIKNFIIEAINDLSPEEKTLNSRFLHGLYKLKEEINIELYRRNIYDEIKNKTGYVLDDKTFQMLLDFKRKTGNMDEILKKIKTAEQNKPKNIELRDNAHKDIKEIHQNFIESIILLEMRRRGIKTLSQEDIPKLVKEAAYQMIKILSTAIIKKDGSEFEETKEEIKKITPEIFNHKRREVFEYKITKTEEIFEEIKNVLIKNKNINKEIIKNLKLNEPVRKTPEEYKKIAEFIEIASEGIIKKAELLGGDLHENILKIATGNETALRKDLILLGLSDSEINKVIKDIGVSIGKKIKKKIPE